MTVQAIEGGKKYLFLIKLDYIYDNEAEDKQSLQNIKSGIIEAMGRIGIPEDDCAFVHLDSCSVDVVQLDGDPLLIQDEGSAFQKLREGHRDI